VQPRLAPLLGGLLPFAVMFIALHYAESAIWTDQFYYLYGFTVLTVILVIVTAAASSIICTYFFLCWEVRLFPLSLCRVAGWG
jgi:transmembrane 9 superfamily protein 2/4